MSRPLPGPGRRGRTRAGRLARVDAFLMAYAADRLRRDDGPWAGAVVVDVGLGDRPDTTVELARAVPWLRVIGVDHDPERVRAARALAPGLDARIGGFDLPLAPEEPARLIRCFNVLREYRPEQVEPARRRLAASLLDGGLLAEGSTDATGSVAVALLARRRGEALEREGLMFATDFTRGFAPRLFRDWLPRDMRRPLPGHLSEFLQEWTRAFEDARARGVRDPRALFVASARAVPSIDAARAADGMVVWRGPLGAEAPEGAVQ